MEAKADRTKLETAKKAAYAYTSNTDSTLKNAMNVINILKLCNSRSDLLHATTLVTGAKLQQPDTQIFNNLLDGAAKIGDYKLVRNV